MVLEHKQHGPLHFVPCGAARCLRCCALGGLCHPSPPFHGFQLRVDGFGLSVRE